MYAAIVGFPTPPPSYHEHIIGKRHFEEKWTEEKCIQEICKDFMMYPVFFGCKVIEGSADWVQSMDPVNIRQKFFY